MSTGLIFDNLVAYSLQIGLLVGVAAFVPTLLRLRQPGVKLIYWQILLAACLLLPLQPWKQVVASGTVEVTTVMTAVHPVQRSTPAHLMPRSEIALLVVLAGVAIRLGWLAVGFWKLRRYRHHSRPLEPAPTWSVEASLLVSGEIASPVTFGWRQPVVLLPANFPALELPVQEAILCHEIMHVRRRDWLFTVAEELVRAALWFHPAIWWLLGEIGLAREQEVDRLAIEITHEREHYMDALLTIAGARRQLDLAPAPLFLRKRHLRHRVILILKEARMSKTHSISTLTTGLAVLAAACWLVTGAFPLTAEPQVVNDAAGVTVNLNGAAVLHRTAVHYPPAALQQGVQGTVQVEVKLDAGGNVSDARVLSGPDELRRAALESVLDWHFTRDVAGTTRVVGIAFELPKRDAVGDYITGLRADPAGGVSGGAPRGVVGGIIGAVPANAPPPPPPPLPPGQPNRIASIRVEGLSDQATSDLLASLPLHEGDEMTNENMQRAAQAVRAFDEHLSTLWSTHRTQDGAATDLIISVAGTQPELRRMVTNAIPPAASLAPAVAGPPAQIRVGGNVQATLIVTKVPPVYPALAKQARVSGVVHLDAIIAKDGTIQELHSLGGPALLIQAAMDAVRQWTYRPTMLNGEPVMVETTIDVNFTLNQ
jgi:protein TonB